VNGADTLAPVRIGSACFDLVDGNCSAIRPIQMRLKSAHSEALADLLPLLLCGEESAVLAFGLYSQSASLGMSAQRDFLGVQADEARHAHWLQRLRVSLPTPRPDSRLRRQLQRFYMRINGPDFASHLAQVAALDSAVCMILGVMRQRRCPIRSDRTISGLFARIHRDEARHVVIARQHAQGLRTACELRELAAETRRQLTGLLAERAAAFESLEICPERLFDRLRSLPTRLFE